MFCLVIGARGFCTQSVLRSTNTTSTRNGANMGGCKRENRAILSVERKIKIMSETRVGGAST